MMLESGDSTGAGHQYTPGCILREMHRIADKVKKILPQVTTPALVVHAKEDEFAGPSNAYYVKEHIGGEVELMILEDSYHLVTVDQERKKVAKATTMFCYSQLSPAEKEELASAARKPLVKNSD
ncbi:alpha/beta hydrolase, partial [Desulfovibrio sp. OttesenSCG-928-G15]|nr:alpha/beta hydrolase [Desulfovibrio sp. OttesenSCG-928-G15]